MEAEPARVEPKGIGCASELDRQCFDVAAGGPALAKDRVVSVGVARGGWTGEAELPAARANALDRTA